MVMAPSLCHVLPETPAIRSIDSSLAAIIFGLLPWCPTFSGSSRPVSQPKPAFNRDPVDGKADQECNPEKLSRTEVRDAAGGKEDTHHRPRRRNSQQDGDRSYQPAPLQHHQAAHFVLPRPPQRKQEQRIEEENRTAFDPSANGVDAHRVSGDAHNDSQRKQPALRPCQTRKTSQEHERRNQHKSQCRKNVRQRESLLKSEGSVQFNQLRRPGRRRKRECKNAAHHHCDRDRNAHPESNAKPSRRGDARNRAQIFRAAVQSILPAVAPSTTPRLLVSATAAATIQTKPTNLVTGIKKFAG